MVLLLLLYPTKNIGPLPKSADSVIKAMANGWRRRRRRTLVPPMMAQSVWWWPFLALSTMAAAAAAVTDDHQQQNTARATRRADVSFRAQRICYQCQMPMHCQSGFCYGDFCVKSMVADKYVSKGCENRTISASNIAFYASAASPSKALQSHGPLYARSAAAVAGGDGGKNGHMPSHAIGIAPGCVKMRMFGVQNTVCYCDDSDYCNGGMAVLHTPQMVPWTLWTVVIATTTVITTLMQFLWEL